jgi:protein gp37
VAGRPVQLIHETPELDWLLLTKRPENIGSMLIPVPWPNLWLGTTCEDQVAYDRRWPILRECPATVHFISYEPAIGPLRLHNGPDQPDWVICGGESGPGARMMQTQWAMDIKADCELTGTYFFMKQMTGKKPIPEHLMLRQFPHYGDDTGWPRTMAEDRIYSRSSRCGSLAVSGG